MEIRFRVWDGEKIWYPEDKKKDQYAICMSGELFTTLTEGWLCDPYAHVFEENHIAMLATGLKDKNGTEMWEGDIVEFNNHLSDKYHRRPIILEGGRFKPITDVNEFGDPEWVNFRIVGNIHQPPSHSSSVSSPIELEVAK